MTTEELSELLPRLRFPEFAQDPGWKHSTVAALVETVTPPKKLPSTTYLSAGRFPIVDQSQKYICGWTNDDEAVITRPLPVIVFGDHTCILKFIDQPFAQGADGIKIFTAKRCLSTVYLYHQLSHMPVVMDQYKRHFSTLKNKVVCFPDPKSGEQQKIADCLGSLDDLIAAEDGKLEALRQHKRGLMQQLFPLPGETVPRLRFTEFRDAPAWKEVSLGTLLVRAPDYGVNAAAVPFSKTLPTYIRITDINSDGRFAPCPRVSVSVEADEDRYLQDGDIVLARTGASVGKPYRYREEDGRLIFAGFLIRVRPHPKRLLSQFLAAYFLTRKYWDWVRLTSARSGQPGINSAEYASMSVSLPSNGKNLSEQRKIADFLNSLDDLIVARGRKLEALTQHKQGLLQQLFPNQESV
ncbi:MAG: hypothetical protein F4X09_06140 [Gammaproteobacteria bacterium]|nr:hypothetical protein [Gammaproteobacteria bacterium]